jgi:hypothetical protein
MDVSHLHKIIDIDNLTNWLAIETDAGKQAFKDKTSRWEYEYTNLEKQTQQVGFLKNIISKDTEDIQTINNSFKELKTIESDLKKILEPSSNLEKESCSELIFLHNILQPLNFVPFILTIWSFVRIYLLPGLSILMPVIMFILPYFIIKFVFHMSMPLDNYLGMLVGLLAGDLKTDMEKGVMPTIGLSDLISKFFIMVKNSPIQALMKVGGIGATLVQTFAQPYMTFRHLSSINSIISTNTGTLLKFKNIYETIYTTAKNLDIELPKSPLPDVTTERQLMAHALLNTNHFQIALKNLGRFESLWRIASHPEINIVHWHNSSDLSGNNMFHLYDTFDINVTKDTRKTFSIQFDKNGYHALLTGPNRGGKSTALRAFVSCSLLAHTYGCIIGRHAMLTPFQYIFASLKADDIPGLKSHFEREVDFTAQTLQLNGPTLVFIDELFHTTNPPDALLSCKVYCNKLWKRNDIVSVISTHLFELVETSDETKVKKICCPAEIKDNKIIYKYGIEKGICKISSVSEILYKYGYDCA